MVWNLKFHQNTEALFVIIVLPDISNMYFILFFFLFSASISLQVEMSSEDEDDCDVYYQVGMENDLMINENNDDQLVVDNLQDWSTT